MEVGELEYARINQSLFEVAKSDPDMLVKMVEVWLKEWVRMADDMLEQCAGIYILGSKGEEIFNHEDQIAKETAAFKARVQQMREDSFKDAADNIRQMIGGK